MELLCDTVVPTVSSNEDRSVASVSENGDSINNDFITHSSSSSTSSDSHISFSVCNNVFKVYATF